MIDRRLHALWIATLAVAALAACAPALTAAEFTPQVGQPGKDVVWVPSPQALVDKMLDMAKVTPADYVMDLGSGDGRTVISAAKRGAQALGVEYNPDMVALSRRNAAEAGVSERAKFVQGDIFQAHLGPASVITLFLLTDLNIRLRPALLSLRPGTRIVSNTFRMGDWTPDDTFEMGCGAFCTAYLWIVPAKVAGRWELGRPGQQGYDELVLNQEYQMIYGTLKTGASNLQVTGRVRGDDLSFKAGGSEYHGRVTRDGLEGTLASGAAWSAHR